MKKILMLFVTLATVAVIALFLLGRVSTDGAAPGLVDDRLARCPDSPNCVCSEYPDDASHYVDPIDLSDRSPADPIAAARAVLGEMGGRIESERPDYLAATFSSSLFGFVDDVEIRLDAARRVLQVRSASRVGRSDFGANLKRVETIRTRFEQHATR